MKRTTAAATTKKTNGRLAQSGPIEMILTKLKKQQPALTVSDPILSKAKETFRLLELKLSAGALKGCSLEARAACCVEYVFRELQQERLDLSLLARVVCVKEKAFQHFHACIGNILSTISQPSRTVTAARTDTLSNKAQPQQQQQLQQPQQRLLRHRSATATVANSNQNEILPNALEVFAAGKNILRNLSILLSGHCINTTPHAAVNSAMRLLHDMQINVQKTALSADACRGHLYNFRRFGPAYQAAAFYQVLVSSNNSTNKQADSLIFDDLVEACTDFTPLQLKQVMPEVEEFALSKKNKGRQLTKNDNSNKKKRGRREFLPDSPTRGSNGKKGRASSSNENLTNADLSTFVADYTAEEKSLQSKTDDNEKTNVADFLLSFQDWKKKVLLLAKQDAKALCDNGYATEDSLLELAANSVLENRGILRRGLREGNDVLTL